MADEQKPETPDEPIAPAYQQPALAADGDPPPDPPPDIPPGPDEGLR